MIRFSENQILHLALALALAAVGTTQPSGAAEPPRISTTGVQLEGNQFLYDAGFDTLDWNGDGLLDIFLPNTSMMSFAAHLNEGTPQTPAFGLAVGYPVNLTETEPQTIEHGQSWTTCDLNSDGLFDLIVFDGQLRYIPNTGTPRGPDHWHLHKSPQFFPGSEKMIKENARFSTGPESMFWNKGIFARQVLTFTAADWDSDGLQDLIVCRFTGEAPGVAPTGGIEQWTGWGRLLVGKPQFPPPADAPPALGPLAAAPERRTYFYKNVGTAQAPAFDAGVELLTPEGQPIVAPNPIAHDLDGDGAMDLLSSDMPYRCNAFRVDWPTAPHVQWFRRVAKDDPAKLAAPAPVKDAAGQPIPAGVQVRAADLRNVGVSDLLVMDGNHQGTIRWYANRAPNKQSPAALAPAVALRGKDFGRFDFMCQPVVVNWFGPDSRDLLIHGNTDAHCKWSLRRTALYRNVATKPGLLKYEFAGYLNFQGEPALVPPTFEERPYDVYGSAAAVWPDVGDGQKRLLLSVDGKLYLLSNLAADGLTFQERTPLNLPAKRNRCKGWQEIAIPAGQKVRYIRISNDRNGMGNLRDSFLHIVKFEALAGGKNHATLADGVQITDENTEVNTPHYRVQRPTKMFDPANEPSDEQPNFTTFGYYIGHAVITLKEPVALERIRFLLSDREDRWYSFRLPFYWQGKGYRDGTEQGEPWYQYTVEVSEDRKTWTKVADTMDTELMRSFPALADWDRDGHVDLILGVLNSRGIWPATKEYRLYRNQGTNQAPRFADYVPLADENGKPLKLQAFWYLAYGIQCGMAVNDMDRDGRLDLVVEGYQNSELLHYRNVTSPEHKEPRFQLAGPVGHPQRLTYPSVYTYFHLGDVDGDGTQDLLNSSSSQIAFFPGVAATAPPAAIDLAALDNSAAGVRLRWTRPADSTGFELRWSEQPITPLNWPLLPAYSGAYAAEAGASAEATLGKEQGLPEGKLLYFALKSAGADGAASPISNVATAATWPLTQLVLRNGPGLTEKVPEYAGSEATLLDAHKPDQAAPPSAALLSARAPGEEKQKVVLVRFKDLPKIGAIERATIELTTLADDNTLAGAATLAVSCNACRDDWDRRTAAWSFAAPGKPWEDRELDAGGKFLSFAQPSRVIGRQHTIAWDVTAALAAAQKEGRDTISLLVRVDNTGKYIAGKGYQFHGSDSPAVELRPKLTIIERAQ